MNEFKIITMQHQTDCEVAAIATALQISYDEAKVVLGAKGRDHGGLEVFWGDSEEPRFTTEKMLKEYFLAGWPNCAFTVYKANALHLLFRRIESIFRG